MNKMVSNLSRVLSVIMSLLMLLSVISIPSFKANAAGGVDGFVERCYTVTLGRGSDAAGFADWKDQLLNGKSVGVNIAYGFLFSSEYKNKNKSNEDYVKDLYKLFMDRDPDQAGFNDWVGKLNQGQSREEVFAGFANSQEFYNICESYGITAGSFVVGYDRKQVNNVNLFVERLYQTCLGRRGDRNGQKDWVNKLVKKEITGIECARSFIQSKEYVNKNLNDADYVENMYLAMMGRASDEGGKNNWLYGLKNGMTRDEVFAGFANSSEFGKICESYKIDKGSYTAKNKGTFNKDNPNNVPVDNNQNNNNNNQNNNNNNQNNNNNNNNNNQNNQNNNQNQQNNNNQNNNNQSNNNQNNNQEQPKKKTAYRIKKVTTESYNDDGSFYDYFIADFTYNSDNQLISIVETRKSTGEFYGKTVYEYDKNGDKTKEIIYNPNGEIGGCTVFQYDNKGELGYMSQTSPDGSQIYYSEEYIDGEVVVKTYYDSNGIATEWVVYDWGSNGKKEFGMRFWYDEKGVQKYEQCEFYEYDASGNCIHEHIELQDGWIIKDSVHEYDSHNNRTHTTYKQTQYESKNASGTGAYWSFTLEYRDEYEYNERGDMVVDKYYFTEGDTRLASVDYYEYEEYECE